MNAGQPLTAYRVTRKVRAGGSMFLALIFFLAGLFCLVFFWPLGLVLILLAFVVDAKKKDLCTCGNCGNEILPSSRLCPTCRAEIVSPTVGRQVGNAFKWVATAFGTVILLIVVVVAVVAKSRQ